MFREFVQLHLCAENGMTLFIAALCGRRLTLTFKEELHWTSLKNLSTQEREVFLSECFGSGLDWLQKTNCSSCTLHGGIEHWVPAFSTAEQL